MVVKTSPGGWSAPVHADIGPPATDLIIVEYLAALNASNDNVASSTRCVYTNFPWHIFFIALYE
jgi:hypothetical protein